MKAVFTRTVQCGTHTLTVEFDVSERMLDVMARKAFQNATKSSTAGAITARVVGQQPKIEFRK